MTIMGIDPGTARIGWGVIQKISSKPALIAYGLISTEKTEKKEIRLLTLFDTLSSLIRKYKPDIVSIEDLYFATNAKTAIAVGEARGVILLACAKKGTDVVSYSPLAIKHTITGDGHADKKQVEKMIMRILGMNTAPKPDDVSDAIAIALTHAYTMKKI